MVRLLSGWDVAMLIVGDRTCGPPYLGANQQPQPIQYHVTALTPESTIIIVKSEISWDDWPMPRYKLMFFVPLAHATAVKRAVFATGAGTIGNYKHCAFQTQGQGQFLPSDKANPAIGEPGKEETVEELKVEILCLDEENTRAAVRELKKAHPYEEVAYEVYKVEDF